MGAVIDLLFIFIWWHCFMEILLSNFGYFNSLPHPAYFSYESSLDSRPKLYMIFAFGKEMFHSINFGFNNRHVLKYIWHKLLKNVLLQDACEMNVSNFSLVEIRPDGSCVPSPTYCNDDTYGWDSDERFFLFCLFWILNLWAHCSSLVIICRIKN